jgi:hypothetical protein
MTDQIKRIEGCDAFTDALSDFLERELSEPMRAAMESHALGCRDCGPLLADLRKLRLDAANLPELAPSRDLWPGIAARIETPVVELGSARSIAPMRRTAHRMRMGLAAAGLVGITASTTYLLTKRANETTNTPTTVATTTTVATATTVATLSSPDTLVNRASSGISAPDTSNTPNTTARPRPGSVAPAAPALRLASNKLSAEATYDIEISRLRKIVDRRRGELDSSTVVVLEKNLKIIDDAIAQCRMALKKDPASAYLNESLTDALDNKVQLLRTAAGLPAKM